ncbi:hypothetical protein Tco_1477417, partial [Tanacetum coccineum]
LSNSVDPNGTRDVLHEVVEDVCAATIEIGTGSAGCGDGEYCQGSKPENQTSSYCHGHVIARVGAGQDGKIESEVRDSSNHIMKANDPVFLAGKVVGESTREYDGDTGKRSMSDAENVTFSLTQCYFDT